MEPFPYGGKPCSTLMQAEGTLSYPNLMCQILLTFHGSLYTLGGVDGGGLIVEKDGGNCGRRSGGRTVERI